MEEEIDLRPYIETLVRGWKWIVGTAVLAGVVAFVISSFIPPTYEATALVAVVESQNVIQFDARIRETDAPQPLRAFPQLALSDQIMHTVLSEMTMEGIDSLEEFRERLSAEAGSDASLIELTVSSKNPSEAASIANNWAAIFVDWANDVYGDTSLDQVQFFEDQLVEAETELSNAEEALVEYQAVNQQLLATNALDALSLLHADLLDTKQMLARLEPDAQSLRNQLENSAESIPATLAEQLTALFLQMKAFDLVVNEETAVPIQFQLDTSTLLTSQDRERQIAFLDGLLVTIRAQATQIEMELTEIEPQLLLLQQQQQEAQTKYNRLLRDQTVAEETYIALARKVEEERITSTNTSRGVRLASRANIPERSIGRRRLLVTAMAVILGTMISLFVIFSVEWWHTENSKLSE